MDWSWIATPLLAFLSVWVAEYIKYKSKKLDISSDKAINECASKHSANLNAIKSEFNARLDEISDSLNEIRSEQLRIALNVTQLQKDQAKYNNVIERTYALEKAVGILDNQQISCDHRIDDLEKRIS